MNGLIWHSEVLHPIRNLKWQLNSLLLKAIINGGITI